ncbi:MAG: general secretion pathway protein GspB [Halochromatium sp.]
MSDRPAPLSGRLRRELPPFSMTVHVYDADPARRFIYLNGNKLREGELSRDGFFVEEVGADGAVLRYDAHRFFQSP